MSPPAMPNPETLAVLREARAVVDALDALLDCDYCKRHPDQMVEHVKRLRAFYTGEAEHGLSS